MNLPHNILRCQGELKDHWLQKSEPCPRRHECARHVVIQDDAQRGDVLPAMQRCVDDGRLSAFMSITEAMKEDNEP